MLDSRKTVCALFVGAALAAAPIFSVAQSPTRSVAVGGSSVPNGGNASAQLLLQIRNLQQEVAELRDRIDRQDYEMQKLKTQRSTNTNANSNVGNQYPVENSQNRALGNTDGVIIEDRDLSGAAPIGGNQSNVDENPTVNTTQNTALENGQLDVANEGLNNPISTGSGVQIYDNDTDLRAEDRVQAVTNSNGVAGGVVEQPVANTQSSQQSRLLESGDKAIKTNLQEEDLYAKALGQLKQQQYEQAVSIFNAQLQAHPRGQRAPDAYYWIGESLYILGNLDSAKKSYTSILTRFGSSRRTPSAMFKIAVIENEQGNQAVAKSTLQSLLARYPDSAASTQAKSRFPELI
ncbi:MAG: tol-pal system protein YbgF [Arenicella sp.]